MNDNIDLDEDDHDAPCVDRVDVPYWVRPQLTEDAREGGDRR